MTGCDQNHSAPADEDAVLMLAAQRGDEEAFVRLYRKHRDRIVNFARRFLGEHALGEEAAQEVFLKLYKARARYKPRSRFSTYLYRIAVNHCLNVAARHERKLTDKNIDVERQAIHHGPHDEAARKELRAALRGALALLPERQRTALLLTHYEGMSGGETAAVLGVSEGAVKSLVHRARAGLMHELSPWAREQAKVTHAV